MLSAHLNYGSLIGLKNHGSDFLYEVTARTHAVAQEVEDLQLIGQDNLEYLRTIGKRLLPTN